MVYSEDEHQRLEERYHSADRFRRELSGIRNRGEPEHDEAAYREAVFDAHDALTDLADFLRDNPMPTT